MANKRSKDRLSEKLEKMGMSQSMISQAATLNSRNYSIKDCRRILELFFREWADRNRVTRLAGQTTNFTDCLNRAAEMKVLTPKERALIKAFFDLLSDSIAHPGSSFCEPRMARSTTLFALHLTSDRTLKASRPPPPKFRASRAYGLIADNFLEALRTGKPLPEKLDIDFDDDLMAEVRSRTTPSDFDLLLANILNESVPNGLRADCASLILNPNIHQKNHNTISKMASQLMDIFEENFHALDWLVRRCLALAVENQAGRGDLIVFMLENSSQEEIERNLENSEKYYGGSGPATGYYLKRLSNSHAPLAASVWAAFYLKQRLEPETFKKKPARDIGTRLQEVSAPRVREFLEQLIR
ncbi:MAG: hypothetical protein AAF566_04955 [Pseudomonadota bacterium]